MPLWWFFWPVVLLLTAGPAVAQDRHGGLSLRVLVHQGPDHTIGDICCHDAMHWKNSRPVRSLQTGYGGEPVWIKIEGIADSGLLQFTPILDRVVLYTRESPGSQWATSITGDTVSNDVKAFETPFMALPLPAQLDANNVYAKIEMPVAVSVSVRHWDLPAFIAMQNSDRTLKTFLLGFIVAIVLYNVIVSALVRDPVFLVNALCIGSLLVMALYLSGYGAAYFWAQMPEISNFVFSGSVMSAVVFGGLFVFLFLRRPDRPMRVNSALFIAPAVAVLAGLAVLASRSPYWVAQAAMLGCAALLFVTILVRMTFGAIRGESRAWLLIPPFLAAVFPGVLLVALQKIGGINPFNLGNNTMEATLALEAMLFSLALASRIRVAESTSKEAARALLNERDRSSALALAAQDNERKRLSKELHDGVGQELLLVVSQLKRLAKNRSSEEEHQPVQELVRATSDIMSSLRRISRDMHPASIEHLGLAGTIEDITSQLNASNQIEFKHQMAIEGQQFDQEAQLHVVRIIQEAMSNVVKHSGATQCTIAISIKDGRLQIHIDDDGIGIDGDEEHADSRFGLGLTSIDERVRSLGGTWQMGRSLLGGLNTSIVVPVKRPISAGVD